MTTVPSGRLPSGDDLPAVGPGTWGLAGEVLETGLRAALGAGCVSVDTVGEYRTGERSGAIETGIPT